MFYASRYLKTLDIFNKSASFLDSCTHKFGHQQVLHFGVLNYEKQHKEGTCKVLGRSVIFSAFYGNFCFAPNQ